MQSGETHRFGENGEGHVYVTVQAGESWGSPLTSFAAKPMRIQEWSHVTRLGYTRRRLMLDSIS